jgi:uncharacterized coiled-coil protein SlyX
MNNDDDVTTTVLTQITDTLEEYNKILAAQQKHLERLSEEVAELKNKVKEVETANSLNSSNEKFLASITERLKVISSTVKGQL